ERIRAGEFNRSGDLGRGRWPRNADRRRDRRDRRQLRQDLFHRRLPRILALWSRPSVRLDHAVPAQGPARIGAQRPRAATAPSRARRGHRGRRRTVSLTETANPTLTQTLLYLDGVSVSFDGYKALR